MGLRQREDEALHLKRQHEADQDLIARLRSEVKDLQGKLGVTEETVLKLKTELKKRGEDEAVSVVQIEDTERRWREQVNYLTFERNHLETKLKELYLIAKEQEKFKAECTALQTQLNTIQQEKDSYKLKLQKLQEDLDASNKRREQAKENAKSDLALLKQDLDAGARIIQRQESFIEDMRKKLKEDAQLCINMQKALERSQHDLSKYQQEAALAKQAYQDKENELHRLRQDLQAQTYELKQLKENDVNEKRQREEWARHKMMLLDQRHREVAALNEALQGISR
mmetsp:Transcript_585/g.910  ORF Transcript_585/g.910 Transcript_585/m.910 type:complete len:283 (+) Transcript_585:5367-6215(+)